MSALEAPFPWFGGKSRAADAIWARFGDVPHYVEPFAGSLAVLLRRPPHHQGSVETVNDLDGFVANFWRAVKTAPDETAEWADWPVIEADLHARHAYLVGQRESLLCRLEGDPDFYDARIAGWWVAGVCAWIGAGYCSGSGPWTVVDGQLTLGNPGQGVHRQLPRLGNAGQGVHRKLPRLGNAGQGVHRKLPVIHAWFDALSARLRKVRVCNGGWTRVLSPTVTSGFGLTGVLLDPPYAHTNRTVGVYAHDDASVAADVHEWAAEHGNDPLLRIAVCGYEGETHDSLTSLGWTVHEWRTRGGYGGGRDSQAGQNQGRERIWFSPACLPPDSPTLF